MTGLTLELFSEVESDVEPRFSEAEIKRLSRPDRKRGLGGGREQELSIRDQILITSISTVRLTGSSVSVTDSI